MKTCIIFCAGGFDRLAQPIEKEDVIIAADGGVALALVTREGLAPAAYAITGARALRTAWRLGMTIHVIGGVLGMVIMAVLALLGSVELLTPSNVLLYQLVWMIPGLLVTEWTRSL